MATPHDTLGTPQGFTGRERWILALILVAAAGLRFVGVSHHLWRGTGMYDEGNNFVAAVLGMWTMHSADPHPYSGYAGFLNWMFFLPMGLGQRLYGEPGAFLAGRAVVAAFSVVNVLLVALVVKRRAGAAAALFGAALLAVSRGEVSSAHWITGDVLVATGFLTLLLIGPERARRPSPSLATGVVMGATIAVKYTGLLLAPVAIVERLRGEGVRAVLRAAGFTLLFFALAAPFAVRNMLTPNNAQGAGLLHSLRAYYSNDGHDLGRLGEVTAMAHVNMGSLALLLAFLSPVLARRRPDLLSPIVLILTSEAVMAPAEIVYPRHGLPASAAYVLLAAFAFDGLWKRVAGSWTVVGASAALLITQPLLAAGAVTHGYAQPPEIDRAADWIESNVPAGRRIVTSLERFRLAESYEVRFGPEARHFPVTELGFFDLVVLVGPEATKLLTGCKEVARFIDVGNEEQALVIKAPCGERPTLVRAPTDIFPEGTEAAWDLDPKTSARFGDGAIQFGARWHEPIEAAAIHLRVGDSPGDWPQRLQVSLLDKEGEWRIVDPILLRPGQRRKQMPPFGQSYVLPEESGGVFGIRFERALGGEFSVTDVAVYGPPKGS